MTAFEGVLAVLHTPTVDGRQLGDPGGVMTLPLPLRLARPGSGSIGRITEVRLDGQLLRYAGVVYDEHEHPDAEETKEAIRSGRLVGMLDLVNDLGPNQAYRGEDGLLHLDGWRMMAATLLDAEWKGWPDVCLALVDEEPL